MFGRKSLFDCVYQNQITDHFCLMHECGQVTGQSYCHHSSLSLESLEEGCMKNRLRRASTIATGLREIASASLCHFPGQCWIVKKYLSEFSLSLKRHRLCILLRFLSSNFPISGWWSVTTVTLGQPLNSEGESHIDSTHPRFTSWSNTTTTLHAWSA